MARVLEYKCPCCGGAIQFDSGLQKMRCPYCATEFELATLQQFEQEELKKEDLPDWEEVSGEHETMEDTDGTFVSYVCEACGGEIIADRSMASSRCPYCDNPVIVMQQLSGGLKPDLIIPFQLDKKTAVEGFKKHHTHIAIVKSDDKVVGLITMEDVLEELVGKIAEPLKEGHK